MADAAAAAEFVKQLLREQHEAAVEFVKQLLREQHEAAVEIFKRLSDRIDAVAARLEALETALRDIEARNAVSLHRPAYVGY